MNLKKHLIIAFIISLISLLGFGVMALLVSKHTIVNFDSTIISYVQGFEAPMLTDIMKIFTFIGGTIPVVVLSFLSLFFLYKVFKHRSELVLFIAAIAGANVLFVSLK